MKKVVTLGLTKIEVGAIGPDGDMGTTLASLGYTYQDTCKMTTEDPETTDHYAEEEDDPIVSLSRGGKTNFVFSLMDADPETLKELLGGKVSGTGATAKWEAPSKLPTIEKSVKITPEQGLQFEIPRMKLVAKFNIEFSKKGLMLIEVVGTVMQPTKAGVSKMTVQAFTAPEE